ncbi:MAG: 2-oxo acid dehydrogenase subunit E2 [Actinobacteria bacterium]|nr:2-oxo acid dehydrogenase subunit E2 [Actinomycetota bacterium]
MTTEIKMPNLGQTTDEVKLLKWYIKKGQKVKKGDLLCEVETDKTTMDVESFAEGTVLKLNVEPDSIITAGSIIAVLGDPDEKVEPKIEIEDKKEDQYVTGRERKPKPSNKDLNKAKTLNELSSNIRATKLVKNIAIKKNIDLRKVKGTGPRGIITKSDLAKYLQLFKSRPLIEEKKDMELKEKEEVYILTPNQQAVSINLSKSKSSIPHYYLKSTVIADNLVMKREKIKEKTGRAISMYSYFIYAAARALKKFPRLNGYFKDNKIYFYRNINIGFAVAEEDELYVPVIHDADKKEISEIDAEVKWLISKTQNKKLERQDISGGTFTISNLGAYPIDEFYGIINFPQAVLLAIGRINKILRIEDDNKMSIKNAFTVSGSFDHRIANGAQAAAFLEEVKKILEEEI